MNNPEEKWWDDPRFWLPDPYSGKKMFPELIAIIAHARKLGRAEMLEEVKGILEEENDAIEYTTNEIYLESEALIGRVLSRLDSIKES